MIEAHSYKMIIHKCPEHGVVTEVVPWAPTAVRCTELYHVVSWATEAVDEVHKKVTFKQNNQVIEMPGQRIGHFLYSVCVHYSCSI